MNYKEKYNEALARAKEQLNGAKVFNYDNEQVAHNIRTTVYNIFPKLKESESKDERIRKKLIELFHDTVSNDEIFSDYGLDKIEVLAWLEKQGGQKPFNKVEPKFKEGDWVFIEWAKWYKKCLFQIKDVDCFGYSFDKYYTIPFMYEDVLSKWTIEDAKDGDVLCSLFHHLIWIYKDSGQYYACVNMNYTTESINTNGLINIPNDVRPATKDEQTILFEKMKEKGYKWNANKKELIKL